MKTINCEEFEALESRIDTEFFGIPSAKAILKKPVASAEKQDELFAFLNSFDFNVITNDRNNPYNNYLLGRTPNAFQTDINIRFRKKVTGNKTIDESGISISDEYPGNDQIVCIADTAFAFSRFLNDPYLPREKALTIYGDIVSHAFGKAGKYFLVSHKTTQVTGFIQFSIDTISSSSTIELIAVNHDFIRQGIGQSLIDAMDAYVSRSGIHSIIVGTQLNNIPSVNFYFSLGFHYEVCNSIYHYWPKLTNPS